MSTREERQAVREKILGGLQARTPEIQAMVDSPLARPMLEWSGERTWEVWARPGLDLKTRCLCQVTMMAALGVERELRFHIRGALRNGNTPEEIAEVIMHVAAYAGMPIATEAMIALVEVTEQYEAERADLQAAADR